MNNIAIITARSGSKGLKDKNIKLLNGKPMLAYSIIAAIDSEMFKIVMVSTDSDVYAEIARQFGAEVPFLRSFENSGDEASSWRVVLEVLSKYRAKGSVFDTVCLLQPTSPMRTANDIVNAYDLLKKTNGDAVTGVCECDYPAEFMMTLEEDKSLADYRKKEPGLPRQMLPTYYRENGAVYIRKLNYSESNVHILLENEYAYVMEKKNSIDIDTIDDFEYAEFLLHRQEKY